MLKSAVALLALSVATAAFAEPTHEKQCIFAAAQRLPIIPGMSIVASRIKPIPVEHQRREWPDGATMVEIDVNGAGQEATYGFICLANDKVSAAQPLGITLKLARKRAKVGPGTCGTSKGNINAPSPEGPPRRHRFLSTAINS
jgi:hypothetical protein